MTITNQVTFAADYVAVRPATLYIDNLDNTNLCVRGLGATGKTYQIQATTNLSSPVWNSMGSAIADGNGRFTFFTQTTGSSARFYRAVTTSDPSSASNLSSLVGARYTPSPIFGRMGTHGHGSLRGCEMRTGSVKFVIVSSAAHTFLAFSAAKTPHFSPQRHHANPPLFRSLQSKIKSRKSKIPQHLHHVQISPIPSGKLLKPKRPVQPDGNIVLRMHPQ
jgi:hypothetical protein